MSYNGSGTFNINTTGQPVVAGTVISSSAFNSLTTDLATGLTTAITKDGQTTTTARITFAQGTRDSTLTASSAVATDASKNLVSVTNTGTGNNVLATSPTITTPVISSLSSASATALTLQSAGTTAVTIDTSQNVGIGTTTSNISGQTSSVRVLTLQGPTTWSGVEVGTSASDSADVLLGFYGFTFPSNSTNYKLPAYIGAFSEGATANQRGANMRFFTQANATAGATERMRINSSGNVGIGTTSPAATLDVTNGASPASRLRVGVGAGAANTLYSTLAAGDYVSFETNSAERARIDSSGNLLVGTTSSAYSSTTYTTIAKSGASIQLALQRTGGGAGYSGLGADDTFLFNVYDSGTVKRFTVTNGGSCQNYTGSYAAFSDLKLKENIEPARGYLADLQRVNVVKYSLKADKQPKANMLGVIAQELEQIFPSMVEENADFDSAGEKLETTTKTVKYSIFVPMLVKAIQELKAINDTQAETLTQQTEAINALTARVVALEAKA